LVIDKNGKLFGKVSVIDLAVVALVLIAVAYAGARYLGSRGGGPVAGDLVDLEIKFYAPEVNDFVVDAIHVGDAAKEYAQYASFGTVTAVEPAESVYWVGDAEGVMHPGSKPGQFQSCTVTMRAKGKIDATGFSLDGTTYFVGKTVVLYLGVAGFEGRIAGCRPWPEGQ
jgi:hypothetical protein